MENSHPITKISCGSEHESTLQTIPSFFIRKYKVERFNPKQAAAPLGPDRTHLVSFSVFRIWLRSTSSSVLWRSVFWPDEIRDFKSRGESCSTGPGVKITARSITFSNSRMLPGHRK